jgi:hypothetical protein
MFRLLTSDRRSFAMSDNHHGDELQSQLSASAVDDGSALPEHVGRGLLLSIGGVVAGVVLTVVIWKMGFVASLAGFAMAVACMKLYELGAGRPAKAGAIPLVALIVAGAVLCMLAVVGSDAADYYDEASAGALTGMSKAEFVRTAMTDGAILKEYLSTFAMMAVFTGLGIFSTLRGLMRGDANH